MESPDDLLCLFSASVSESQGDSVIEVPLRAVESGPVKTGEPYRVALIRGETPEQSTAPGARAADQPQPPVEPGEMRYVEVEDLGKQGDGIARVERGYVIIIPGTAVGDRVKLEITDVEHNFAVGEVIEST